MKIKSFKPTKSELERIRFFQQQSKPFREQPEQSAFCLSDIMKIFSFILHV